MTYSALTATRRTQPFQRNKQLPSFRPSLIKLGPVSNTVILIVLACLIGLLYLTQVTKTNALGYQLEDLRERQTSLKQEHDDLAVSSARLQSLDRVATSAAANKLADAKPAATIQN